MKICLLTRRFALESGGIGRVGIEIRDRLRKLGHEVHTVSTNREDLVSYFKYTFMDMPFKIPKGLDIYHAITPMESIWIPKERSIATVLDIIPITHPDKHGARMGGSRIAYTVGRHCFAVGCNSAARCKRVVCISEHVRQEFLGNFSADEDKVKVIRLGVREDLEPREKRNGKFQIGYLGQLDRRKRVDLLIKAFKGSDLDGELVLGGKGFDELWLRSLASGDDRIRFVGVVPDDKLVDFYNSLDLFVFPTVIEGYGLPIVEAMACRKPVIVLSDAIIPWEVKLRCIIVRDLEMVLGNQKYLEGLVRNVDYGDNYQWAKSHSWDKCVKEYVEVYEEILNHV